MTPDFNPKCGQTLDELALSCRFKTNMTVQGINLFWGWNQAAYFNIEILLKKLDRNIPGNVLKVEKLESGFWLLNVVND